MELLTIEPITDEGIPRDLRERCGEAIDAAVEEFGFPCVRRTFIALAALNGFVVRVLPEDKASR
jgi:hypothetical protein